MLDTDTRDLVSMHTDGEEIISNVKYSPGRTSPDQMKETVKQQLGSEALTLRCFGTVLTLLVVDSGLLVHLDGSFLAVASHDNYVYIYAVMENGRKYSRVGKCSVSAHPQIFCNSYLSSLKAFKMIHIYVYIRL